MTRSYALSSPAAASRREAAPRGSIHVEIGGAAARPGASSVAIYRAGQRLLQPSQRLEAGVLFDGLELGEYDLYLEQAPFVHQHVVLASDGARSDVVLTAPRAAAIVGFVYDAQDNPVIDAKVQAFHRDYPSHELAPAGALVLTDQDGAFRITGLVAGRYRISAAGDGISGELDDVPGDSHGVIVRLDERRR